MRVRLLGVAPEHPLRALAIARIADYRRAFRLARDTYASFASSGPRPWVAVALPELLAAVAADLAAVAGPLAAAARRQGEGRQGQGRPGEGRQGLAARMGEQAAILETMAGLFDSWAAALQPAPVATGLAGGGEREGAASAAAGVGQARRIGERTPEEGELAAVRATASRLEALAGRLVPVADRLAAVARDLPVPPDDELDRILEAEDGLDAYPAVGAYALVDTAAHELAAWAQQLAEDARRLRATGGAEQSEERWLGEGENGSGPPEGPPSG